MVIDLFSKSNVIILAVTFFLLIDVLEIYYISVAQIYLYYKFYGIMYIACQARTLIF